MDVSDCYGEFGNGFIRVENKLDSLTGWWFGAAIADLNNDGREDIVAGNLGANYKYKTSPDEPFQVFVNDFDESGT